MPSKYPKGSEWRRWDLHIHTPASILYNEFKNWDSYLTALEIADSKICAIGITDYAVIDGYKRIHHERINKGRLKNFELIIPNIEFRITPITKEGSAINIHILVDIADPNHITKIEDALNRLTFIYNKQKYPCNRQGLTDLGRAYNPEIKENELAFREGVNQFKPDITILKKWFEEEAWLKNNALIAVSNRTGDGASGISHDDGYKAVRLEIYRFSDIILSSNPSDKTYFCGKGVDSESELIEKIGGLKPCVHGSDAHKEEKLFQPDEDRYCWIKADPTFEGLRQILFEPEARVHIGKTIPETRDDNRIISSISIKKSNGWFQDIELPINPALVSIIGSKGSGKTALADLIAYAAGSWEQTPTSFLHKAYKEINGTEVAIKWLSGPADNTTVTHKLENSRKEKIKYLSQHFVEKLCSEDRVGRELLREIEMVIFDYLDDTDKLDATDFLSLRAAKTADINDYRSKIKSAITSLNREIYSLNEEVRSRPQKEQRIKDLQTEKDGLLKQTPKIDSEEEQKLNQELAELRDKREKTVDAIAEAKQKLEAIKNIEYRIAQFKETTASFYNDLRDDLIAVGIEGAVLDNFKMAFKGDVEDPLKVRTYTLRKTVDDSIGKDEDRLPAKNTLRAVETRIRELESKSTLDQAKKQKTVEILRRVKEIDSELKKLSSAVESIDNTKNKLIENKTEERWTKYLSYFDSLKKEQEILEELYAPLRGHLIAGSDQERRLEFYIKTDIKIEDWASNGELLIDKRNIGPYRAPGEIAKHAQEKELEINWQHLEKESIRSSLLAFRSTFDSPLGEYKLSSQLLSRIDESKYDDWLFSTDHISLSYGIRFDGTELENLSPGTKGIVLLILYLEMDKNDRRPLVIDQPEENLDSESVYKVLTGYFCSAKTRRQIILITHNPNLVVNTDSEQVIIASYTKSPDPATSRITYNCGSLEDSRKDISDLGTREKVCEILEGGERAFHMREQKYAFGR